MDAANTTRDVTCAIADMTTGVLMPAADATACAALQQPPSVEACNAQPCGGTVVVASGMPDNAPQSGDVVVDLTGRSCNTVVRAVCFARE